MTKNKHFRLFYEDVFGENIDERALLLVGLWSGHKDSEAVELALPSKYVDVLLIPDSNNIFDLLASSSFGGIKFT
jgi:hypothetical protein